MFVKRLLSGIVLLGIAVLVIVFGGVSLAGILLLLSLTAFYELGKALGIKRKGENNALMYLGFAGIVIYYVVLLFTEDTFLLGMIATFMVIAYLCLYVFTFPKYKVEDIMSAIFSFASSKQVSMHCCFAFKIALRSLNAMPDFTFDS